MVLQKRRTLQSASKGESSEGIIGNGSNSKGYWTRATKKERKARSSYASTFDLENDA